MWGESPFRYRVLKLARGSLFSHDCHPCLVLVLIFFFLIFGSLFLLTAGGALVYARRDEGRGACIFSFPCPMTPGIGSCQLQAGPSYLCRKWCKNKHRVVASNVTSSKRETYLPILGYLHNFSLPRGSPSSFRTTILASVVQRASILHSFFVPRLLLSAFWLDPL